MKINIEDIHVRVIRFIHEPNILVEISFEVDNLEVFTFSRNQRGLEAKLRDELYNIVKEL